MVRSFVVSSLSQAEAHVKSPLHWTLLVVESNPTRNFRECLERSATSGEKSRITSRTPSELNRNTKGSRSWLTVRAQPQIPNRIASRSLHHNLPRSGCRSRLDLHPIAKGARCRSSGRSCDGVLAYAGHALSEAWTCQGMNAHRNFISALSLVLETLATC